MSSRPVSSVVGSWIILATLASSVNAAPPFASFNPFRRIEANPANTYQLTDSEGPWMVLASTFSGPGASDQAMKLVQELRKRYKIEAYQHRKSYDFTKPVTGLGLDKYGAPRRMRHARAVKYEEIAVLGGNFDSIDDPGLKKTLERVKYLRPECLDLEKNKSSTQTFAMLREVQKYVIKNPLKKQIGPMGKAFVSRNPLLPKEFFTRPGLDPFVVDMNKRADYSLLTNRSLYTVRVASFRGDSALNVTDKAIKNHQVTDKLVQAAEKATRLVSALRKQGKEAYVFHDRHESIVTIGGFSSVGNQQTDGKIQLDPRILQIMQTYGAERRTLPGGSQFGLKPKMLNGVAFDVQPMPVVVPRGTQ